MVPKSPFQFEHEKAVQAFRNHIFSVALGTLDKTREELTEEEAACIAITAGIPWKTAEGKIMTEPCSVWKDGDKWRVAVFGSMVAEVWR